MHWFLFLYGYGIIVVYRVYVSFWGVYSYYTLIWNNGEYIIEVESNNGKNALIDIAKSVQKVEK